MTLYCDLDGILADWDKKATEIFGRHPKEGKPEIPDFIMWPILAK